MKNKTAGFEMMRMGCMLSPPYSDLGPSSLTVCFELWPHRTGSFAGLTERVWEGARE